MIALSGTPRLVALALRRDKIVLPLCVVTFAGVAGGSAAATDQLYPDQSSLVRAAEVINATPALVALYGPIYDTGALGAVGLFKLTAFGVALVGLFAALVVIRHTRADEELGRTELLAAGSVGRHAPLAAALVIAIGGSLLIGLATGLALVAAGLPAAGAAAFGLTWACAGFSFAAVGAVAAQLTESARAARGLAGGVLAVAYVLRAVGDTVGPTWVSWTSPVGWAQQIRPFGGDRWAVAAVSVLAAAALAAVATGLLGRRDLGAGLLARRSGPEEASRLLGNPLGLAWRLQRTAFAGWLIGFVLLSVVVGQLVTNIGDMLDSPTARELILALGGISSLTDAFLSVELSFVAVCAAAYGISSVLRLAAEESSGRAELVAAGPVSRSRWGGSHLLVALAGAAALMLACGLTVGLAHALAVGDSGAVGRDLVAALARIPAVWVMIALAQALYGLSRRAAPVAWGVLVGGFLATEIGPLLDLPAWVRNLSPFTHVPDLPGGEVTLGPVLVLLGVAAALVAAGLLALQRRDLTTA